MTREEKALRMRLRRYGQSSLRLDPEGADRLRVRPRASRPRPKRRGDLGTVNRAARKTARQLRKSFSRGRRPYQGRIATRFQRSTVKISYAKNLRSKRWAAHGSYLARHGAAREGEKGLGFDHEREDIDLYTTLDRWQRAGDAHVFKVMVSPERGAELDMTQHARALVARMERDLGTRLEWAGIVHTNTGLPHAHLVIRGIDECEETLTLAKDYISHGIREVSRELATRKLGYRTDLEIDLAREAAIDQKALTELDRTILWRADSQRRVAYKGPSGATSERDLRQFQEMRRLKVLEGMGLARQVGLRTWVLSEHTEQLLKEAERAGDIARTLANGRVLASNPNARVVFTRMEREGQQLTGRVIGTGREPGREGGRYLLLEAKDGLVHFVPLPRGVDQTRGEAQVRLDSVVTLTAYLTRDRAHAGIGKKPGVHLALRLESRHSERAKSVTPLRLDLEIVERIKREGRLPAPSAREHAREWSERLLARARELKAAGVIEQREPERFVLALNWRQRLERLRALELSRARERGREHDTGLER